MSSVQGGNEHTDDEKSRRIATAKMYLRFAAMILTGMVGHVLGHVRRIVGMLLSVQAIFVGCVRIGIPKIYGFAERLICRKISVSRIFICNIRMTMFLNSI